MEQQTKFCKYCGGKIPSDAVVCTLCGRQVETLVNAQAASPNIVINNANQNTNTAAVNAAVSRQRSKWAALLLCLFLGCIGAHKFYEGKTGMGVLYLLTLGLFGIGVLIDFIALLFILAMMRREKIPFRPEKGNIPALFGRCFCGTVGLLCNFYAIGQLNLSDANMLNKLSPFFAILFSVFLLKEKPSWVQVLSVLVAFAGSVCIIKPSFRNPAAFPAFAGAIGGMGAGAAYTFVRKLGARQENSKRIVFYFSAFSCLVCLPFLIFSFRPMTAFQLICLILAGTFACVGQLGITKAYLCAPAKEISVYDYTQVIFAAALGFLVFGDVPDALSVLGYVLICGAGVGMYFYNNRKAAA